jgi:hypothetical protein
VRVSLLVLLLGGCSFSAPLEPGERDAAEQQAIDAAADAAVDAPALPACPSPPAGCTPFDCPMSTASCYYYCPNEASSGGANGTCRAIATDACLVTLNDAIESACVLAAAGAGDLIYIGLRQPSGSDEPDDDWGWYCGSSDITSTWKPGEPNNSGTFGEDCGAMDTAGLWIDVGCSETFRYVCEAPRPTP